MIYVHSQSENVSRICSCGLCIMSIGACGQDVNKWSMCSQSTWSGSVHVIYVQSQSEHVVRICSRGQCAGPVRACG